MAETINTQTTGYECVGIEKIEQTYEGLFDNKPNIITIYLTNGDTHQFKVMNGSQGVGIDRIEQRQTSTVSGGRNEFAIILTNGKEYTFSTYNGSGGSGSSGSFNQVLQHLNNLLMPSGKSYLYYNGSSFEWKSPDGSTGGGTADLSEYSWWGRKFDPESKSITGEMSGVTGIEFQSTNSETVIRKKLHLDNNGDLCFDGNFYATGGITALGSSGGTSGGSGVSLGTLLTKLNSDNPFPTDNGQVLTYDGSNFVWKIPTGSGGSSSSSSYPLTIYNGSSNTDYITYDGSSAAYLKFKSGFSISKVGLGYEISVSGGGSGSSSRIKKIKLFTNNSDYPFETIELGTADTIGFMQGDNITFQSVVKDFTNVIKISATGGSGGSSTGGSVDLSSYLTKTEASTTYAAKSHSHSASQITGLPNFKVNNATNADKLANSRTIWGQSFNGTGDINGHLYMGSEGGGSIRLWMNNGNMLDRTNNILHIGNGLKESSNGEINLDAYATKVYTDNMSKHYDFKSNVFDVNSNQIHFGSETNGGKIYWDAANNAFKIEGNVYATGGITALGVSNNATTSNNVDFTFRSVTINGTSKNKVQLTDEGLTFVNNDVTIAYYKNNSIGLYDSANDACSTIFRFTDGKLTFDPNADSFTIKFNQAIECNTDEDTLYVGIEGSSHGNILFSTGSKLRFNYNNKNYTFNVANAIEQGILTI